MFFFRWKFFSEKKFDQQKQNEIKHVIRPEEWTQWPIHTRQQHCWFQSDVYFLFGLQINFRSSLARIECNGIQISLRILMFFTITWNNCFKTRLITVFGKRFFCFFNYKLFSMARLSMFQFPWWWYCLLVQNERNF